MAERSVVSAPGPAGRGGWPPCPAIRARRAIAFTSVGLAAILAAAISGASFVGSQGNGASLGMALATAVAMFCYLAAIFSLR